MGVTYDTGALIAAERGDRAMWALHRGYLGLDVAPDVPAAVLAQAWRGGAKQARLARMLQSCSVEALDADRARACGALAAKAGHDDVVAVSVAEAAIRRGDSVVTSDPSDIGRVAEAIGAVLHLVRI